MPRIPSRRLPRAAQAQPKNLIPRATQVERELRARWQQNREAIKLDRRSAAWTNIKLGELDPPVALPQRKAKSSQNAMLFVYCSADGRYKNFARCALLLIHPCHPCNPP